MDPFTPAPTESSPNVPPQHDTTTHSAMPSVAATPVHSAPDNAQPMELNNPYEPRRSLGDKIVNGMSWYGLELALSVLGLTVATAVINYGIYALFNYMKGIENPLASQYVGEFSLWVAATMLVWLPLAVVYYLRARAEAERYPLTRERVVHKLCVGFFLFNVVVAITATVFSVIYALIRMSIGIDDQAGDTVVRVIVPGLLATVVNSGLFWAYARHAKISRKLFALVFAGLGLLITLILLIMSVSNVQANSRDQKAAADLGDINSEIASYYTTTRSLPNDLGQLDGLKTETKGRLSRYEYKKEQAGHYQLCATFFTDTQKQQGYDTAGQYGNDYKTFTSFGTHGTGEKCFKLSASYSSLYDDYINGLGNPLGGGQSQSSSY